MERKIIFMRVRNMPIPPAVLEFCYKHTPLIEPLEDGSLFLDLTGCRPPFRNIIKDIAIKTYREMRNFIEIGIANSKLLAASLVTCKTESNKKEVFQYTQKGQFSITIALREKGKKFLASIPLQDFYAFKRQEIRKLNRLGLKTVGDLETIPFSQLVPVLKKNIYQLLDKSRGIDNSPVLGLYPPAQITYQLPCEAIFTDFTMITQEIKKASKTLAAILERRHSGCSYLELKIMTAKKSLKNQRKLTSYCYKAKEIDNILHILLRDLAITQEIKEFYIILGEISPLSWQQPDLFTLAGSGQNKKAEVANILEEINYKFPGKLSKGKKIQRREQILSFWDPWRY